MSWGVSATGVICEVTPNTGRITVLDVVVVHDAGRVINPMIVDGQVQGGFTQGLGTVLLEEMVYESEGQPQTTTLLDYHVPTIGDAPVVRRFDLNTPSDTLGGFRGVGELGMNVASATIANAVHDALRPFGIDITSTAMNASRIRGLLRDAGVQVDVLAGAGATLTSVADQ